MAELRNVFGVSPNRGSAVRTLQQQLKAEGFDPGAVDGVFGPHTRAAVLAYQMAHGLRQDGAVGENTSAALRDDLINTDRFQPSTDSTRPGTDGVANITHTTRPGARTQRIEGTLTVNGHSYDFRSGGFGRGSLPTGSYDVTPRPPRTRRPPEGSFPMGLG